MRTRISLVVAMGIILIAFTSAVNAYQTATSFQFPLPSWNVGNNGFWSCYVSCYHLAEDVGAPHGTAVYASGNGLVKEARYSDGYGGIVVIEHYTGTEHVTTITGHMYSSSLQVSAGQEVAKGQLIGYVADYDNNGHWASEHVHFGIHKGSYQTGNSCDGHWVYAGYDYGGCTYSNWYTPSDFINSHMYTYTCAYHDQSANELTLAQGQTVQLWVEYTNTGTATWYNDPQSHPNDYVELKSCDAQGNVCNSFLYDASLGWLNAQSPATMNEASRTNGQVARFEFSGKVPTDATLGLHHVYFRPNNSANGGTLMQDWGGMQFQVTVLEVGASFTELSGDFNGDGKTDVALHNYVGGTWTVALSTGSSFTLSEDYWLTSFGTGDAYVPIVGDFNNDGKDDVGLHKNTTGQWYVALSTGSSFDPTGTTWTTSFGTNPAYRAIVGDFNNDGKDDVGLHKNTGEWYVAFSTGSAFSPTGTLWTDNFGTSNAYVPIVGDFNGDGKDDVGLHKNTTGQWYAALSTGSAFNPTGSTWTTSFGTSDAYTAIVGDFNEDGKDDVGLHKNTGEWYVAFSTGSAFSPTGTTWATSFGTSDAYVPIVGDFNEDGKDDVGLHKYTSGQWYGALNTGSGSFDPTGTVWLSTYSIEFGGSEKIVVNEDLAAMPTTLSLSQNYPNPFNPVTTISYSLPVADHVILTVYNILGQKVETLVDEDQAAGEHSLTWDANEFSSGVYFYRIEASGFTSSKKMILLK